jgi:hypothetical protein
VKIPVAALAPFPSDVTSQENWAEQVVATPVTMATLGQGLATAKIADLQAKYDAAYENMGAKVVGQYKQGMINSGTAEEQQHLSCASQVRLRLHACHFALLFCGCELKIRVLY